MLVSWDQDADLRDKNVQDRDRLLDRRMTVVAGVAKTLGWSFVKRQAVCKYVRKVLWPMTPGESPLSPHSSSSRHFRWRLGCWDHRLVLSCYMHIIWLGWFANRTEDGTQTKPRMVRGPNRGWYADLVRGPTTLQERLAMFTPSDLAEVIEHTAEGYDRYKSRQGAGVN